jgi:hypothetical protein
MMRLWLLRLAPLVVAALFGAPRHATAAELAPSRPATGVVPAPGVKAMLARESRPTDSRLSTAPYCTPAASCHFTSDTDFARLAAPGASQRRSSSPVTRQPPARAPPVQS